MIEINETKPVEASLVIRLTGDDVGYFMQAVEVLRFMPGPESIILRRVWEAIS